MMIFDNGLLFWATLYVFYSYVFIGSYFTCLLFRIVTAV